MNNFPETEVLTSLVSRVFRVLDWTLGDPHKTYIIRYRGHLLSDDSAALYDQLAESLKPYDITPLFRKDEQDEQVVILVPSQPRDTKPQRLTLNLLLLVLTIISVMFAGAQPEGPIPQDLLGQLWAMASSIWTGWPFAVSLMSILLAHEFGHYLVSRFHDNNATLPFFIPLPLSPLGTMGAFIQMKEPPKNKRVLLDIGMAGPLAGMVVAIPVLFIGLSLSTLEPVGAHGGAGMLEGNSLLYLFAKYVTFGKLLPAPASYGSLPPILYWLRYFFTGRPLPFGGMDVFIHPVAFAGWAGLLVTALNLVPLGTLDGGHVMYALFGDKARKLFPFAVALMVALGFVWPGWWLWAALLMWLGRVYAEPRDQITELDPVRKALAIFVLVLFVLVFTPVPLIVYGA
jgi:membrane-associated protease RseP (regulator of RpoE activity)